MDLASIYHTVTPNGAATNLNLSLSLNLILVLDLDLNLFYVSFTRFRFDPFSSFPDP